MVFKLLLLFALLSFGSLNNAQSEYTFPDNFMFGTGSAAYQVEGAWNEDGKGENIWDYKIHNNRSYIKYNETADVACDSYHKTKEDVALLVDLGVTHYRFSIAWTRILPTGYENHINLKGIQYYQNLVDELLAHNITPVVTLHHWDLPQPLQELGGWTNEVMVDYFVTFARVVFQHLPKVKYWSTFNQPQAMCKFSYGNGNLAPRLLQDGLADYVCFYLTLKAHAAAYHLYKNEFSDLNGKVFVTLDGYWSEPKTNSSADIEAAERRNQFEIGMFSNVLVNGNWPQVVIDRVAYRSKMENFTKSRLPAFTEEESNRVKGTFDIFAVNFYYTHLVADAAEASFDTPGYTKDIRMTTSKDETWEQDVFETNLVPWAFRKYLNWIKTEYGDMEFFVLENGIADSGSLNDQSRMQYLKDYLTALLEAMHIDKVNVLGYTFWSFTDNFQWTKAYDPRFGLYYIDFKDPNRTRVPKLSVEYFKEIVATHRIPDSFPTTTESSATTTEYQNSSPKYLISSLILPIAIIALLFVI